jgi:hypothetical protein
MGYCFKCSSVKNKCFLYAIVGKQIAGNGIKTRRINLLTKTFLAEKQLFGN